MSRTIAIRWALGLSIVLMFTVVPFVYYRSLYAHAKRLREVTPGKFYRCGQLTAAGFEDAVKRLGIRTVLNVQDDFPDPLISNGWGSPIRESELCAQLGVRYVTLAPDLLPRPQAESELPRTINQFLAIVDDPNNYPILLHCKAGLHRTGCLTAVYRMEYEDWTPLQALQETLDNGFGRFKGTASNEYIRQYILNYTPRKMRQEHCELP